MPGSGKARKGPQRAKGSKRQAEDGEKSHPAKKSKKSADKQADHEVEHEPEEVLETITLRQESGKSGIGKHQEQQEGIIHFDKIFKDVQFSAPPEIEPLRCGDDSLAFHLPKQIQDKITSHQYINLALLLKGNIELEELCSGGTLHLNEKGGLETRPKSSKNTIRNIDEWTDAFTIFASVYLSKFPAKNLEILKYMSIIREAATRYPVSAWCSYDQQFRLRQANEKTRQPWSSLNGELWLRLMSNPSQNNAGFNTAKRPTGESPGQLNSNPCFAFNEGNCSWKGSCKYKHVCSACNSSLHGQANCPHTWQRPADGPHQSYAPPPNPIFRGRGHTRGRNFFRGSRYNRR